LRLKCSWSAVEAADFNRVRLKCGETAVALAIAGGPIFKKKRLLFLLLFLGNFIPGFILSNGFFKQYSWNMLQIILWKCGWSAVEAVDFNRTVDFSRVRLISAVCGWNAVEFISAAFQPSQEMSDDGTIKGKRREDGSQGTEVKTG